MATLRHLRRVCGSGGAAMVQRILSREQFQAVMAGSVVAKTPHFALHRAAIAGPGAAAMLFPLPDAWLGVVLPKRWARLAVTRNAIRRQVYEGARRPENTLPMAAWVVRLRSGFSREQFVSASSDALKRASRLELDQLFGSARAAAARQRPPAWHESSDVV